MGKAEEITVPPESSQERTSQIQIHIQKLSRNPGVQWLHPLTRRLEAISAPTGRAHFNRRPLKLASRSQEGFTILSANLWHDWPRHRRLSERLETFAQLVETEKVDVALLQEVARTPTLTGDEWLAERLGMAHVYTPANGHAKAIGFEEGLAIFSRFPLSAPRIKELGSTAAPLTRRRALGITLDTPWGEFLAFSLHLSLFRKKNSAQVASLQNWIVEVAGDQPAIIGGDFNSSEESPQIAGAQRTWVDLYRQVHPNGNGITHGLKCPFSGGYLRAARLDYIFLKRGSRTWSVVDAFHVDTHRQRSSDHFAVLARLQPA